ncbi:unnamed protein product [Prunus brigantina]
MALACMLGIAWHWHVCLIFACMLDFCLYSWYLHVCLIFASCRHEAFWSSNALRQLDFFMWVWSHPLLFLVFSPKLEEERMEMLDVFHDARLDYWYFVSSGL